MKLLKALPFAARSSSILSCNNHDYTKINIVKIDSTVPSSRNRSRNEGKKSRKLEKNWLSKKLIDRYYLSLRVIVLDLNNVKHNGEI